MLGAAMCIPHIVTLYLCVATMAQVHSGKCFQLSLAVHLIMMPQSATHIVVLCVGIFVVLSVIDSRLAAVYAQQLRTTCTLIMLWCLSSVHALASACKPASVSSGIVSQHLCQPMVTASYMLYSAYWQHQNIGCCSWGYWTLSDLGCFPADGSAQAQPWTWGLDHVCML